MKEITIIIPNFNGKEMLKNCIQTLENQTINNFRVLVIDNGSTDGSTDLTSETIDLEIVPLKENRGFCGAVNLGFKMTETPYAILLNNDTEVDKDFVRELYIAIQKSNGIFSCGAQMLDFKNREIIDNAGDYYTALGWAVARGKGGNAKDFAKDKTVFSSCGGAVIYRMELIRKVGLLDENHFAYLEDVDLGYRALIHGYENRYAAKAKVYHIGSATTGTRYNEKKVFLAARNNIFLLYKNMPFLQLILNLPLILIGFLIKALFFCIKGFQKDYFKGISEGLRTCGKCNKVEFQWKYLPHYIRIQLSLWLNIFKIIVKY